MGTVTEYMRMLEALTCMYTVEEGHVKILLIRKETEPYKGYWVLPRKYVRVDTTVEEAVKETIMETTGLEQIHMEESYVYSNPDRDPEKPVVGISYLCLCDHYAKETMEQTENIKWFDIETLPKLGYDHETMISDMTHQLRNKIVDSDILKKLFPSDFTLPEIQRVYESILGRKFDRRNFRKKFILLDLIEDTNDCFVGGTGRPAKLYRFKENTKKKNLF
ncbi:MAG: NUDIX hydrolase [Firmicutes bacterium]|nr:NUDIX hydrolase [Bacillota bacterium]